MNKLDRIKILVNHIIVSGIEDTQKGLGIKLGYTNESSFSQILNGKVDIPKNFIKKLLKEVPGLNVDWIETGEGEMINQTEGHIAIVRGSHNTAVAGNGNHVYSETEKFLDLLKSRDEALAKSQEQITKSQEQMDKLLLLLLENNSKK